MEHQKSYSLGYYGNSPVPCCCASIGEKVVEMFGKERVEVYFQGTSEGRGGRASVN
jgi:hypothetical protein